MEKQFQYYYNRSEINAEDYQDNEKLESILLPKITKIKDALSLKMPNLTIAKTQKNTLAYVLNTYGAENKVIRSGASALLDEIKYDYQFVIFSENMRGKYKKVDEGDLHGIQINITYFKYIFQKVGDRRKIVRLFLSDPKPDEIEESVLKELFIEQPEKLRSIMDVDVASSFLRQHALSNPDEIQTIMKLLTELSHKYEIEDSDGLRKILDVTINILDLYKIKNPEEFQKVAYFFVDIFEKHSLTDIVGFGKAVNIVTKLLQNQKINSLDDVQSLLDISKAYANSIINGTDYFEKQLAIFKTLIDGNEEEEKIRDFIFKDIWILDFRYFGYEKTREEKTDVGDIDLAIYGNQLGINSIVIAEFKRADVPTTTIKDHGENKPVILSVVGRAISQTIHYVEQKKLEGHRFVEGIVIIGRKRDSKDFFVDKFNLYLHGVQISTFDDLYDNANKVINTFKNFPRKSESKISENHTSPIL